MTKGITYKDILGNLRHLLGAVAAHPQELPHLEPFRQKLWRTVAEALEVRQQPAALETAKRLRQLLAGWWRALVACLPRRGGPMWPPWVGEGRASRAAAGGAGPSPPSSPPSPENPQRPSRSIVHPGERTRRAPFFCLHPPDSAPSEPDNGSSHAAHFHRLHPTVRRTQRIFIVSRRRLVVRSAFPSSASNGPSYAAHFHRLETTARRTQRISVVCVQRSVVRGAFPSSRDNGASYAAHFHRLETLARRPQRISSVRGRRVAVR